MPNKVNADKAQKKIGKNSLFYKSSPSSKNIISEDAKDDK
jgi:hypothetical protein